MSAGRREPRAGRRLLVAAVAVAAFTACGGHPPLGEPDVATRDDRIIGVWELPGDEMRDVTVWPFNEAEYLVIVVDSAGEPSHARGFLSRVGGNLFLNVEYLGEERAAGWQDVYRIEFHRSDVASVRLLKSPGGDTHEFGALRARLEARMDDPDIYEDLAVTLRRRETPPHPWLRPRG